MADTIYKPVIMVQLKYKKIHKKNISQKQKI